MQDTQLTAFFKANQTYPSARDLLYVDFPTKFRWDSKRRQWLPRKKDTVFGRLVYIPPNGGEKFYARLVLSVAKNLQCFEDLRRFNGTLYPSIREACLARGLLHDDGEWKRCLEEGKLLQTGTVLRSLFVVIVRDCNPVLPMDLWNEFKSFICDDLQRQLTRLGIPDASPELTFDYGLYLIESTLQNDSNKSMKDVGMAVPTHNWKALLSNSYMQDHLRFDPFNELKLLLRNLPLLNVEQSRAFNCILDAVVASDPKSFFLMGAAGAGKTFVYKTLCHALRSRELVVLCVAYSGIAAQLLAGGRTAHSMFKIPFELFEDSTCSIPKKSSLAAFLKTVRLIIWDECYAQNRNAFEAVDRTLRDIMENEHIFGGVPCVFGGDYLQTLPVVKKGGCSDIVHACLLSSPLWANIAPNVLRLETNMRVGNGEEDRAFAVWLRDLARGVMNDSEDMVELPRHLLHLGDGLTELIAHTYADVRDVQDASYYEERCVLSPRNTEANEINENVLDTFPGETWDLWSNDDALDADHQLQGNTDYPPELLHTITPSGFPRAHLKLKIGCPIMVLRNLQPREGVCNGTRAIVTNISTRVLEARLFSGQTILIPRIKLISADPELPFHLARLQFPVSLSFAMTINKAQGQTFDNVSIDLRHPVFSHGQLYVALSRARHFSSIRCIVEKGRDTRKVKNVVFRQVIL